MNFFLILLLSCFASAESQSLRYSINHDSFTCSEEKIYSIRLAIANELDIPISSVLLSCNGDSRSSMF
jgi:hypothetical protein